MTTGVIIARFQSPYLHEGHKNLIERVQEKHATLVIVLGISPVSGSRRNPYDYFTRERMIKKEYPNLVVLPLCDHPSDEVWSSQLDQLLHNTFQHGSFVLYGSRDSFVNYYHGKIDTVELPDISPANATELRQQLSERVSESPEFRAGIVYAYYNQYTKVYPTVDVAVFRNEKTEILLGKKANSNKWRLVGGYVDPEDVSYEVAAKRELQEECGEIVVSAFSYELSHRVDDWRYRKEVDKIITTVYSCDFISGIPKAQDDIVALDWLAVDQLPVLIKQEKITEEHIPIFEKLIEKYLLVHS